MIRHIAISPDNAYAATLGDDKSLRVYSLDSSRPTLLSTRATSKRGSHLSFTSDSHIIISDKVGDVYSYPLHPPRTDPKVTRPTATELASDPSRNPDATLLLGHVSVLTTHLLTPDGKHIITADRDEHVRVSRYPKSYIIEQYLLGSDGFVSALHIPPARPHLLFSAGGEQVIRIWDWTSGEQVASVDIWEAVLPGRKVQCPMRQIKRSKKTVKLYPDAGHRGSFNEAPEGWMLPSGQGVCVKRIDSIVVGHVVVVVFISEG